MRSKAMDLKLLARLRFSMLTTRFTLSFRLGHRLQNTLCDEYFILVIFVKSLHEVRGERIVRLSLEVEVFVVDIFHRDFQNVGVMMQLLNLGLDALVLDR